MSAVREIEQLVRELDEKGALPIVANIFDTKGILTEKWARMHFRSAVKRRIKNRQRPRRAPNSKETP